MVSCTINKFNKYFNIVHILKLHSYAEDVYCWEIILESLDGAIYC